MKRACHSLVMSLVCCYRTCHCRHTLLHCYEGSNEPTLITFHDVDATNYRLPTELTVTTRSICLNPSLCWLLTKCESLSFHIDSIYFILYTMRILYCICLIRKICRCRLVWEFWDPKVHFLYLVQRASYDDTYRSSFLLVLDWSHDLHEDEVYSIVTAVFSWVNEQQQCLWSRKNQCVRLPAAAR
jgi:hypothetical protein